MKYLAIALGAAVLFAGYTGAVYYAGGAEHRTYVAAEREIAKMKQDDDERNKEIADAHAKLAFNNVAAERDAALKRLRDSSNARAAARSATSGQVLCLSGVELDSAVREASGRFRERFIGIATQGDEADAIAVVCRDWAAGLR